MTFLFVFLSIHLLKHRPLKSKELLVVDRTNEEQVMGIFLVVSSLRRKNCFLWQIPNSTVIQNTMIPTSRPSSRLDFISAKNSSSPRTMSSMLTKTVSILGTFTFFHVSKPLVNALAMLCSNRNWTSAWKSKVHFAFYGMRQMSKKNHDYLQGFLSP